MVLTPEVNPHRGGGPLSPLLLAQQGSPIPHVLRRSSTGNYSQLSDFHLDPYEDKPEGNGVSGVRHVELSVSSASVHSHEALNAMLTRSEWRIPVFKEKVLQILRHLVGRSRDLAQD
jgi:hypothetical protein